MRMTVRRCLSSINRNVACVSSRWAFSHHLFDTFNLISHRYKRKPRQSSLPDRIVSMGDLVFLFHQILSTSVIQRLRSIERVARSIESTHATSICHIRMETHETWSQYRSKLFFDSRTLSSRVFFNISDHRSFLSPDLFFLGNAFYSTHLLQSARCAMQVERCLHLFASAMNSLPLVYFTHSLNLSVHALFFITVLDIAMLSNEPSYIGCITERILKERTTLYDVFVDCDRPKAKQEIAFHTTDPVLQSIVKVTSHDRRRFKTNIT
jgi:hypothetical protein